MDVVEQVFDDCDHSDDAAFSRRKLGKLIGRGALILLVRTRLRVLFERANGNIQKEGFLGQTLTPNEYSKARSPIDPSDRHMRYCLSKGNKRTLPCE